MEALPRSLGLAIAVAVLLATVAPVGAVPGPVSDAPIQSDELDSPDPSIVITIQLGPNGSARWNVTARFMIDSSNDSRAFDRLADEFESGNTTPGFSLVTFETLAAEAGNRTGREMVIRDDVRRTHRRGTQRNGTGRLSLVFTWTNFATTPGSRIVVGDVFEAWSLDDGQRLVIYPPAGHGLQSAAPGTDGIQQGGPVWNGPQSFDAGEPTVTYEAGLTPTFTGTTTGGPVDPDLESALPMVLGLGLLAVLAVGLFVWWRRETATDTADDATPSEPVGAAESADVVESEPEESPEAPEDSAEVDPELLSDEERVEWLLEQHDGRMRQADIVTETGWSNAKVSQLLSAMDEADRVEKLRMGRENLISLPDVEDEE